MGKKTKVGKQRKDKYYHLAKETGYRSRAAFKLIQLNRKYEFLQKSRVCIDLCAAPGGWMQVAQQNMPVSSIIIGVDLFPIKPIEGCISLTEDITTEKCISSLRKELQNWKVDIVLNDGAPNVGKNWLYDSYQQACLTLSAVKLASQFLKKGGWFITKVFRSKDYNPLMWVFKQLFKKVHATKPQASRHESAEIFVVCQYYLAPDKIDSRFFDSKHVFEDLDIDAFNVNDIYHPEKTKAKAIGYPDNDYTLFHSLPARDFINHETGLELLKDASEIVLNDPEIVEHPKTTEEIKECCKDLKVLGRKDIKLLLAWRKAVRTDIHKVDVSKIDVAPESDAEEDEDKDLDIKELTEVEQQINDLEKEETRENKRKKKKVQKERVKLNERLNLKMVHKNDGGPVVEENEIFNLKQLKSSKQMERLLDQVPDLLAEEEKEEDDKPKSNVVKYKTDGSHLSSSGMYYKDSDSEIEMESDEEGDDVKEGLNLSEDEDEFEDADDEDLEEDEQGDHPLITDLDHRPSNQKKVHKAQLWFQRDAFKNVLDEEGFEDADLDALVKKYKEEGVTVVGEVESKESKKKPAEKKIKKEVKAENDSEDSTDSEDSDYDVERTLSRKQRRKQRRDKEKQELEAVKPTIKLGKRKLTEEELALGTMMIDSKRTKRDLIDAAWNRYTFNDDHLPDWFVEDEKSHMTKPLPVPAELVSEYRKKLQDINIRPIKKVVEAKARKQRRALKKLDKAKKKVESIMDNPDVTQREKEKQVKQAYKKTMKKKEEITFIRTKKQRGAKAMPKPVGVKGRYKVVDPRMKKDLRAEKSKKKRGKTSTKKRNKKN